MFVSFKKLSDRDDALTVFSKRVLCSRKLNLIVVKLLASYHEQREGMFFNLGYMSMGYWNLILFYIRRFMNLEKENDD